LQAGYNVTVWNEAIPISSLNLSAPGMLTEVGLSVPVEFNAATSDDCVTRRCFVVIVNGTSYPPLIEVFVARNRHAVFKNGSADVPCMFLDTHSSVQVPVPSTNQGSMIPTLLVSTAPLVRYQQREAVINTNTPRMYAPPPRLCMSRTVSEVSSSANAA
jgi:hypothetical protein